MLAAVLIAAMIFLPASAHAKDIYRWIDQSGDTNYGDRVPPKYKGVAQKLAPGAGVSIVREERTGETKDRSAPVVSSYRLLPGASTEVQPGNAVSSGSSNSSGAQDSSIDCDSLRRQYWESQACFNQFRNANGSVKPEAFSQCREVQNPAIQCGPLIIGP